MAVAGGFHGGRGGGGGDGGGGGGGGTAAADCRVADVLARGGTGGTVTSQPSSSPTPPPAAPFPSTLTSTSSSSSPAEEASLTTTCCPSTPPPSAPAAGTTTTPTSTTSTTRHRGTSDVTSASHPSAKQNGSVLREECHSGPGAAAAGGGGSSAGVDPSYRRPYTSNQLPQKCPSSNCVSQKLLEIGLGKGRKLLRRTEIPRHLQFNPYIDSGYRPLLTARECVLSLLYLHNETVNIITHGVPMLYILLWWPSLLPWHEITVPYLPWIHLVSTVSPWVGSTIYHLFMNHKSGESFYRSLLHLDMFGIWITQSFGALTTVYASVSCLSVAWIWRTLLLYCCVSLWCLYKDCLAVIGGFVGALRIPEKWIPGQLDLLANSHHIMHVVVVYAVYHLHQGAVLDLVWLSGNSTCASTLSQSPV
ncbi:progestin and adipoQ receptor family member 4 isoform X2 [Oratosquilla oratoria]|uniref:progestin and adipoQ receptor family member 4 isoform X2 n=1 Tax=Oratosquilla oratoria TaxID=337810 RepID=UPI003F757529